MLMRTGVALATVMLVLPLTVVGPEERAVAIVLVSILSQKHIIQTKKHVDEIAEVVNSEEINRRQTEQQREDPAQRVCTHRLHEADGLSKGAEGLFCRSYRAARMWWC